MDEHAKNIIDTTHMPPNISWHPDAERPTAAGTLSYRRGNLTIAYHVIITVVLNVFVAVILKWNAGVIVKDLDISPVPVMEIVGMTVCGLLFIALGLYFIYRAIKIITDRIELRLSPDAVDCAESYCRVRKSHHFPIDENLKIERYVATIGRNREFYSLVIKSGKTAFPFGTLAPQGLRWLESTLKAFIETHRPAPQTINAGDAPAAPEHAQDGDQTDVR